ncbi:hypothetical protein L3X38_022749 [Prunus dulcis]|uniref:Retrotransposon Copia-like N-terminal domain-containing protein n=1 Tax=Prunus dulcis TaxID=3755 RepID=A0AAD4Z4L7_PRUDU|nr:hypothetical protein L3X38_022749 [Prunus dulcis]
MGETKSTEKSIDVSDPLTLHHSDHPGIVLVSRLLEGYNYGQWSRSMRLNLSAKNKIGFVDGSVKAPASTDAKHSIWQRCNDMVLSWILNSVHPDIAGSVIYAETAAEVWNDLKERFSQGNDSRIYQIQQEIVEHRQGQQSVSAYYTKTKALWDELSSYHHTLSCTRGGLKEVAARQEKERVMQFLMGLNETYAAVRGQILMMQPLPDTRKVHALILQQERQVEVAARRDSNTSHHAMKVAQPSRSPAAQGNLTPLKCSYCDQERHSVDRCYFLHGFPVGHKLHGKNVKPPNRRKSVAHNTQASSMESTQASTTTPNEKPIFTTEEYTQLMALLRKENGNTPSFANATGIVHPHSTLYWIVDNGATDHISHSVPSNHMTVTK